MLQLKELLCANGHFSSNFKKNVRYSFRNYGEGIKATYLQDNEILVTVAVGSLLSTGQLPKIFGGGHLFEGAST